MSLVQQYLWPQMSFLRQKACDAPFEMVWAGRQRRSVLFTWLGFFIIVFLASVFSFVFLAPIGWAQDSPIAIVQEAIERGEDVNALVPIDETVSVRPLHMVLGDDEDNLKAGRMLLEAGADPNGKTSLGTTALHMCAERGLPKFSKLLIEFHANPNARTPDGRTPLHVLGDYAATLTALSEEKDAGKTADRQRRLIETAKVLIAAGADPNIADDKGRTALHYAADNGSAELVRLLLKAGADPHRKDTHGMTPLQWAALFGSSASVLEPLIEAGSNPAEVDLHAVLNTQRFDFAIVLVQHGAPLDRVDDFGRTPLHVLAIRGMDPVAADLARLMLAKGADLDAKDYYELRPIDYAEGLFVKLVLEGASAAKTNHQNKEAVFSSTESSQSRATLKGESSPSEDKSSAASQGKEQQEEYSSTLIVNSIMSELSKLYNEQNDLINKAAAVGDLAKVAAADELPEKIEFLEHYIAVCQRLEKILSDPERVVAEYKPKSNWGNFGLNLDQKMALTDLRRMFEFASVPLELEKLRAEMRWAEAVVDAFDLMAKNPTKWSPDDAPNGAPITITDPSFIEPFSRAAARVRAAEAATNAVNEKYRRYLMDKTDP